MSLPKSLPKKQKKSPSPIKINDYFTNPLHKIKQASFVQSGFNQHHLNTFVKTFTNRADPNYISLEAVKQFIREFTNGDPKLMRTYEQFFIQNFKIQKKYAHGQGKESAVENIQLEHFIEFFIKQSKVEMQEFGEAEFIKLFRHLEPLNQTTLLERAAELQIPITKKQAANVIKMINLNANVYGEKTISEKSFLKAMIPTAEK